jgi:hypothetical protein
MFRRNIKRKDRWKVQKMLESKLVDAKIASISHWEILRVEYEKDIRKI